MIATAHTNCSPCCERRARCIYRYLGPCKFDEMVDCEAGVATDEAGAAERQQETTERMLDQSFQVLADDQQLAAAVLDDETDAYLNAFKDRL